MIDILVILSALEVYNTLKDIDLGKGRQILLKKYCTSLKDKK